ncbi:MAG: BON domain-containing protein [Acidobacteriota bacterium]|nr:BON domain-containing protein [Acidobacteriota bacterium]
MRYAFKIFLFVLFSASIINAQDLSREQKLQKILDLNNQIRILEKDFLLPDAKDLEKGQKENFNVIRLNPREKYDRKFLIQGGGSYYSFTKNSHNYQDIAQIGLEQNNLKVGFAGADYGFIADLGEIPLAEVSKEILEVSFLANYKPPTNEPEVRLEQRKTHDYNVDGITYKRYLPAVVGHAYILRAISFEDADVLVALRIYRKDTDGSLIIFWKLIENFAIPRLERNVTITSSRQNSEAEISVSDTIIAQALQAEFMQKGLNNILVDATTTEVVLRGTVPKGKMAEAVQTAQEVAKRKVKNQLTEQ